MPRKPTGNDGVQSSDPVVVAMERVKTLSTIHYEVLAWREVVELRGEAEYKACAEALVDVKEQIKKAEAERKLIVGPLNAVVRHVNAKWQPYMMPREELERHLKSLLARWREKIQREELAKAERLAKAAERKGAAQLAMDIRETALAKAPIPANEAITYQKHWTYEIVDESKIPREYLLVDERKLAKLAGPDAPAIPGVVWVRADIVKVTT